MADAQMHRSGKRTLTDPPRALGFAWVVRAKAAVDPEQKEPEIPADAESEVRRERCKATGAFPGGFGRRVAGKPNIPSFCKQGETPGVCQLLPELGIHLHPDVA